MLSSVLRSKRAIEVNILIMRAFVRMKELLYSVKNLALKNWTVWESNEYSRKIIETGDPNNKYIIDKAWTKTAENRLSDKQYKNVIKITILSNNRSSTFIGVYFM